jgi:hypothetical protein
MPIALNVDAGGGPQGGCATITKSDATVYDPPLRFFNVAVAGAVTFVYADGTTGAPYLTAGPIYSVGRVTKVMSTGTAATGLTGWTA